MAHRPVLCWRAFGNKVRIVHRLILVIAVIATWMAPVSLATMSLAQVALPDEPILGQGELPIAAPPVASADDSMDILVIGDALGGGLGAGLTRMAEEGKALSVTNRFNESSGVARPEVYDWPGAIPRLVEGKDFDAAVILLGSNDRQDIRLGQFRYAFNTPEWSEAYKLQAGQLLDALKAAGVPVYWVSIPPMAEPAYNTDMMALNDHIKNTVVAKGEQFVDVRPSLLGADGSYTDRGPDETGALRKLRASDGVTFFKAGNNKLAQLVLAAIETRGAAPVAAANSAPVPDASVETRPSSPLLGQSLGSGEFESIESGDILVAMVDLAKKQASLTAEKIDTAAQTQAPKVNIIEVVAAPGTAAEKLLTSGVAESAPTGRFDDFSYVAPVN